MKLVFSRKGFDSAAGGGPSPIMSDGRMLTLPIPEPISDGGALYSELHDVDGTDYLTLLRRFGYTKYGHESAAHLDPDLVPTTRSRQARWRGMLGQANGPASHLVKQRVGSGDLFLFWGLFANADGSQPLKKLRHQHALFGYLEVAQVVNAGAGEVVPDACYHPHFQPEYRGIQNKVYVATERFSHDPSRPGWGVFRWSPTLRLTPLTSRGITEWRLPSCFHPSSGTVLTHHIDPAIWTAPGPDGYVTVQRRGNGQEFVCEASPEIQAWAIDLITRTPIWAPEGTVTPSS